MINTVTVELFAVSADLYLVLSGVAANFPKVGDPGIHVDPQTPLFHHQCIGVNRPLFFLGNLRPFDLFVPKVKASPISSS